jgi:hypothetical protein
MTAFAIAVQIATHQWGLKMKSGNPAFSVNRRILVSRLALLPTVTGMLLSSSAQAQVTQGDPLASWNDGPAKQAIIDFVRATTDRSSPKFVPLPERIATFD